MRKIDDSKRFFVGNFVSASCKFRRMQHLKSLSRSYAAAFCLRRVESRHLAACRRCLAGGSARLKAAACRRHFALLINHLARTLPSARARHALLHCACSRRRAVSRGIRLLVACKTRKRVGERISACNSARFKRASNSPPNELPAAAQR